MANQKLRFRPSQPLTLGVDVEVQLLVRDTLDLKPASPTVLSLCKGEKEKLKAEYLSYFTFLESLFSKVGSYERQRQIAKKAPAI